LRPFKFLWIVSHRLRRYRAGHFDLKPTSYEIYTKQSPQVRTRFEVPHPTGVWWNRLAQHPPKVEPGSRKENPRPASAKTFISAGE
jgi:hypothetical protein